jgi:starch synthase
MDYPLVLLEAMALERPIVVAARTPAAELAEGGGALVVEPNEQELTRVLAELFGDAAARARLGAAARRHVNGELSRERMAAAYEALYDGLLS